VFNLLGMFAVLIGGNIVFFGATPEYANGQLNPEAYFPFALACVPIMVLGIWGAAAGTHGQIPHLEQPQGVRRQLWRGVVEDVVTAFKIPAFVAVVAGSIMFSISQGMVQALHLYLATYFFELTSAQITFLFAGAITGIVTGSLCSRPMARLIPEKRDLFIAGTAWYALWTSSVIMLRLVDVLPGNEHPLVAPLYITTGCISALGLGVAIPLIGSMIADITDEHERRHGRRQEGIYYAAGSLVGKVVGGAGPVLAGFIIDLAGIAPGTAPGNVDPAAIERFGWATGPSVLLLSAISIACIWFYDISRQRHAEIITQIEGRRS
jgi:Na+/melibiose symporter-like transporter